MNKVLGFLVGKRTYIVAALMGVTTVLVSLGYITWDQAKIADAILAPFGLAFLRMSITDKTGSTGPK